MKIAVAARWNETLSCIECGGWNARWSSNLAGHSGVQHLGDLSQYCRDCKRVFDVDLADLPDGFEVRMNPEDVGWADRREWVHCGSSTWWEDCPGNVRVHVGHPDTSRWLHRVEARDTLYTVRVVGEMPKRLVRDKVNDWKYVSSYVNAYEFPGRVSLYLPKSRLELVSKEKL